MAGYPPASDLVDCRYKKIIIRVQKKAKVTQTFAFYDSK